MFFYLMSNSQCEFIRKGWGGRRKKEICSYQMLEMDANYIERKEEG